MGVEAERGSCSPCCGNKPQDVSPLLEPKPPKPVYRSDLIRPVAGSIPASRTGFLASFLVDARGGAMTGHRHWGIRVVIPPGAVNQPTRINCRYQPLNSLKFPPPFMEREALASRVIEISPALQTFRSPVLLEIPHFASNAGAERETVVLRSDDGESWNLHVCDTNVDSEIYQDVVTSVTLDDNNLERIYDALEVKRGRVARVLTSKFPKYFAVITRIREQVQTLGPEGGKVCLPDEPRCRATFPKGAVHKKIKVALQVQTMSSELVQAAFGRSVDVSKVIAVEPRKRKFHQPIFVSIPLPCPANKINKSTDIRLLCSVTGSSEPALWEDLTGSTPLELNKDVVHFSTKVSAIFWLVIIHDNQRDSNSALTMATRLYQESRLVPYSARISIFYRENFPKAWVNTMRIYLMTDDKAEKVVQSLQGFKPLLISRDIEITEGSDITIKLGGNILQMREDPFTRELLPVSTIRTSFIRETLVFTAFKENALTLLVQPKDSSQPLSGSFTFYRRLSNISKTQNLLISHIKISSDGQSEEGVKEDVMFHGVEEEFRVPGDYPCKDRPLPKLLESDYEEVNKPSVEEDLYERIEMKADDGRTTLSKIPKNPQPVIEPSKEKETKNKELKKEENKVKNKTLEKKEKQAKKEENKVKDKTLKKEAKQAEKRKNEKEDDKKSLRKSTLSLNRLFNKKDKEEKEKHKAKSFKRGSLCEFRDNFAEHQGVKHVELHQDPVRHLPPKSEKLHAKSFKKGDFSEMRNNFAEQQGVKYVELHYEPHVFSSNTAPNNVADIKPAESSLVKPDIIITAEQIPVVEEVCVKANACELTNDCIEDIGEIKNSHEQDATTEIIIQAENGEVSDNNCIVKEAVSSKEEQKKETISVIGSDYGTAIESNKAIQTTNEEKGIPDQSIAENNPIETSSQAESNNLLVNEDIHNESENEQASENTEKKDDIIGFDIKVEPIEMNNTEAEPTNTESILNVKPEMKSEIKDQEKEEDSSKEKKKKEKKKSFIKEWQEDLKEFFSGKNKKKVEKSKSGKTNKKENSQLETESKRSTNGQDISENIKEDIPISHKPTKSASSICESEEEYEPIGTKEISGGSEEGTGPEQKVEVVMRTKRRSRSTRRNTNSQTFEESSRIMQDVEKELENQEAEARCSTKSARDRSVLSAGGKPKVVVPSPRGIPKPKPISRITDESRSNRSSVISSDEEEQQTTKVRAYSIEDSEEFKKAVDSFDEIFKSSSQLEIIKRPKKPKKKAKRGNTQSLAEPIEIIKATLCLDTVSDGGDSNQIVQTVETMSADESQNSWESTTLDSDEIETVQTVETIRKVTKETTESIETNGTLEAIIPEMMNNETYRKIDPSDCVLVETIETVRTTNKPNETIEVNEKTTIIKFGGEDESIDKVDGRREHFSSCGSDDLSFDSVPLDAEAVKNVDGTPRQRKGSSRFSRKQNSRSNRSSIASLEEAERISPDLTTRLLETNDQMQRVDRILDEKETELVNKNGDGAEKDIRVIPEPRGHSVVHTTVLSPQDPIDKIIGDMIQQPTNQS